MLYADWGASYSLKVDCGIDKVARRNEKEGRMWNRSVNGWSRRAKEMTVAVLASLSLLTCCSDLARTWLGR